MSKNEIEKKVIEMDDGYYYCENENCKTWHQLYHNRYYGKGHEHLDMLDENETNSSDPEYYYCRECREWHKEKRDHLQFRCHVKKGTVKRLRTIIL